VRYSFVRSVVHRCSPRHRSPLLPRLPYKQAGQTGWTGSQKTLRACVKFPDAPWFTTTFRCLPVRIYCHSFGLPARSAVAARLPASVCLPRFLHAFGSTLSSAFINSFVHGFPLYALYRSVFRFTYHSLLPHHVPLPLPRSLLPAVPLPRFDARFSFRFAGSFCDTFVTSRIATPFTTAFRFRWFTGRIFLCVPVSPFWRCLLQFALHWFAVTLHACSSFSCMGFRASSCVDCRFHHLSTYTTPHRG